MKRCQKCALVLEDINDECPKCKTIQTVNQGNKFCFVDSISGKEYGTLFSNTGRLLNNNLEISHIYEKGKLIGLKKNKDLFVLADGTVINSYNDQKGFIENYSRFLSQIDKSKYPSRIDTLASVNILAYGKPAHFAISGNNVFSNLTIYSNTGLALSTYGDALFSYDNGLLYSLKDAISGGPYTVLDDGTIIDPKYKNKAGMIIDYSTFLNQLVFHKRPYQAPTVSNTEPSVKSATFSLIDRVSGKSLGTLFSKSKRVLGRDSEAIYLYENGKLRGLKNNRDLIVLTDGTLVDSTTNRLIGHIEHYNQFLSIIKPSESISKQPVVEPAKIQETNTITTLNTIKEAKPTRIDFPASNSQVNIKKCPKCMKDNNTSGSFCSYCGNRLDIHAVDTGVFSQQESVSDSSIDNRVIYDIIHKVIEEKGLDSFFNSNIFSAYLADLAPQEEKIRKIIKNAMLFGAGKEFFRLFVEKKQPLDFGINTFKEFVLDNGYSEENYEIIVDIFIYALKID